LPPCRGYDGCTALPRVNTRIWRSTQICLHTRVCVDTGMHARQAVMKGSADLVSVLVENGAPIEYTLGDSTLWSPLFDSIRMRNSKMTEALLKLGAQTEVATPAHGTPFQLACVVECLDAMRVLEAAGANLESCSGSSGASRGRPTHSVAFS
jgi:hypothetical protein